MRPADETRFGRLVSWAESHGAFLHPRLEIYHDEFTKFSVRVRGGELAGGALASALAGEPVLSCTAPMTLSSLNAIIGGPLPSDLRRQDPGSPAFPPRFMETNPLHVIGRFYLIQQYLQGRDSAWSTYIETLPQPEHLSSWCLPAFWPAEDTALLEQTNAAGSIEEMQGNVAREHKKARKLLKELDYPGWRDYSRLLYHWAFCIFTSRSFRPSLVLSAETQERAAALLPAGCRLDDFSVLLPLFDIPNHAPTARVTWDAADSTATRFVIGQSYGPGEQIFNNYGMKTNSELLLAYGFVLPETDELHNDYVHLRKREQAVDSPVGGHAGKDAEDFLISLRPLTHPSSLLGRSRQFPSPEDGKPLAAMFDYFEDALLWDLCFHLATPEEQENLKPTKDNQGAVTLDESGPGWHAIRRQQRLLLSRVLSVEPLPELLELSERVKEALITKLVLDYERLLEGEGEVDGGSSVNRGLALKYREQYTKVLRNSIAALNQDATLPG